MSDIEVMRSDKKEKKRIKYIIHVLEKFNRKICEKKTFYIIYRRVIDQLAIISNYLHVKCFLIIPVRDTIYFSN